MKQVLSSDGKSMCSCIQRYLEFGLLSIIMFQIMMGPYQLPVLFIIGGYVVGLFLVFKIAYS